VRPDGKSKTYRAAEPRGGKSLSRELVRFFFEIFTAIRGLSVAIGPRISAVY
jgi:hypothetical protein